MPYGPEGDPTTAKIAIVGEAPARNEIIEGRPFVGPAGWVLNECLESAGIIRSECYITNVFDVQVHHGDGPSKGNIYAPEIKEVKGSLFTPEMEPGQSLLMWSPRGGLTAAAKPYIDRMWRELSTCKANVIVPLGAPALEAVCGLRGVMKWRGSIMPSRPPAGITAPHKCVPAIHPANALHGQYTNRYIIRQDFSKARRQSDFPEIERPKYIFPRNLTYRSVIGWLAQLRQYSRLGIDIEVERGQVSYIAFATSRTEAVSIPYSVGGWSEAEEASIWHLTAKLLEDATIEKIFQNGMFDVQFLFQVHDILVQGTCQDTMIGHHLMFPDFPKGLAFLGSLYTDQPYWKDMVKHGDIDKEDG